MPLASGVPVPPPSDAAGRAPTRLPALRGLFGGLGDLGSAVRRQAESNGLLRWGLVIAAVGLGLGLRFALSGALPASGFPFLTFFPVVIAAAWLAGLRAGLAAAALSVLAARWYFMAPVQQWGGLAGPDWIALVFFAAVLVFDCVVVDGLWRALDRAREAQARLRAADQRKNETLAVIAHELRNPLQPLTHAVAVLERDPGLSPASRRALAIARRQVRQQARIVEDLLDAGRVARGEMTLQCRPMRLGPVLEHLRESFDELLAGRGQVLEVDEAGGGLAVVGDEARLVQALGNLVANASKFSPSGARVRVSAAEVGGRIEVRVQDGGRGLAPQDLQRVFALYEQGTEAGRPLVDGASAGLGIGLAIVRHIAERHGGRAWAESEGEGRGACFVLELPLAPAA